MLETKCVELDEIQTLWAAAGPVAAAHPVQEEAVPTKRQAPGKEGDPRRYPSSGGAGRGPESEPDLDEACYG